MRRLGPLGPLMVGCVLAVVVGEAVLSHSSLIDNPPGQFKSSATRAFQHVPNFRGRDRLGHPIRLNSRGNRDREHSLEKPPGTYRIVVLGDSVTFGDGVAVEETFSDRLESLLNETRGARPVEVINTGTRGYNTYQEMLLLKEEGLWYNPDLVLLCYVGNDAEPFSKQKGLIGPGHRWLISIKDWVRQHSYLYAFFRKNLEVIRRRTSPQKFNEGYADQFRPDHPGWIASVDALKEIKQVTTERGIDFLLAVYPQLNGIGPGESQPAPLLKIHNQILETGFALGINTLDLRPAFRGVPTEQLKISPRDLFHPNPLGHRLVAAALAEHIQRSYSKKLMIQT